MALFSIAQDALLEEEIHNGVASGSIKNENDLDEVNQKVNKKFSIWGQLQSTRNKTCVGSRMLFFTRTHSAM